MGVAWILPEPRAIMREKGAILGELASVLVGLGSNVWVQVPLFAAVLFGMKDLFFVDGREV